MVYAAFGLGIVCMIAAAFVACGIAAAILDPPERHEL